MSLMREFCTSPILVIFMLYPLRLFLHGKETVEPTGSFSK